MRIFLPKALVNIEPTYGPLFFLAGPVRGGGDWQKACCSKISDYIQNFCAALPCRYPPAHPLWDFTVSQSVSNFDHQLTWERHYLDLAGTGGCIIFWLPCESKENPRTGDEPYAMDTRGELGEWRGRLMSDPKLRVVIGAEPDFPGLSQIERNFSLATRSRFPIYGTLKETVEAALKKVGV